MTKTKEAIRPADNIARKKFSQSLKVMLTPEEVADRADRAAHKFAEIQQRDAEMKAVQKDHKSKIEIAEMELDLLSKEVRDKSTYRQTDCERQLDFNAGLYREVRLDTAEIINERKLLESEKQLELPFPDEADDEDSHHAHVPYEDLDESWRAVPIREALPDVGERIFKAFDKAGIDTMGKFSEFQTDHGEFWIRDLEGVGPEGAGKIADAAEKFWASRKPS